MSLDLDLDPVQELMERNRSCASRFVEIARKDFEGARMYFDSLLDEIQDYVRYSNLSEEIYKGVFENHKA